MKLDDLFVRHKRFIIVLLFFIALAPRLYKIDYKNVWLDEYRQSGFSGTNPFDFGLAQRASHQKQPPLDYFIQSILISNFGLDEVGIRIHAAIFGAWAAVLFFLLMKRIVHNYLAILMCTIAFVFHPYLIRYSQEGRPTSIAVFFCLLYLYVLFPYLQRSQTTRHPVLDFATLTIVQTGFLLSVGFQPVVFLLVSSMCLAPHLFFKEKRSRVILVYLSSALAFLISFPIINMTIGMGVEYHFLKSDSIFQLIKNLTQGFQHVSIHDSLQYYRVILKDYMVFFMVVIAAGTIGFLCRSQKRDYGFVVSYFVVFFLIYPVLFTMIFKSLVSYILFPRYYLTFAPICLAAVTLAVFFTLNFIKCIVPHIRPLKYVCILALIALFIYSFISSKDTISFFYKIKNAEWKKIYNVFKYKSEPGDIAYMLNLVKIDQIDPYFISTNFYYPDNQSRPVTLKHARNIPHDLRDSKQWKQKRNVYIVTNRGSEKIKKNFFAGMENIRAFRFVSLSLIRIQVRPGRIEDFITTLRVLKEKLYGIESNYLLYTILIQVDLDNGNMEKAKKNIETLELANKKKKLNKLIRGFKEQLKKLEKIPQSAASQLKPEKK